jgi:hypothetical protein
VTHLRKLTWLLLASPLVNAESVEFGRDIKPILSDKCFTCHGPDAAAKKIPLRLDSEHAARRVIDSKELVRRVTSTNKALRMPPIASGRALSDKEIDLLRRWVDEGGKWQKHWAFVVPSRPAVPPGQNAIDYFVRARLAKENLKPSAEAERRTLIRRATFDLTGLPPTPAEVEAFVNDSSTNAYEKVIDRLLASPRYGERMAYRWLDAARYADTSGYQSDGERFMWRWRDWVINAFNRNMRFDQFTLEQIAGDMLPNATLDQRIATGFNRNHRGNSEGGIVPEEYAVEYVIDRVETTSTVFLGLTLGCARCHNHKYDPFTQKEFYQTFAYFNNIPENGRASKYGNSPPYIPAPTPAQQATLREMDAKLAAMEEHWRNGESARQAAESQWKRPSHAIWMPSENLDAVYTPAQTGDFDGTRFVDGGSKGAFGYLNKFTLSAWINAAAPTGAIVTRAQDVEEGVGYGLYLKDGKLQANFSQRWLDDALRLETVEAVPLNGGHLVTMSYDGSRAAAGVEFYIDGVRQKKKIILDELNQSFSTKDPVRIGAGLGPANRFKGTIGEVRIYSRVLDAAEVSAMAGGANAHRFLFLETAAPAELQREWKELKAERKRHAEFLESLPTVMVMEEMPKPRDTFLLQRGQYDHPGEKVAPGVPAALPPLPVSAPNNRLGYAEWLISKENPLTARVTVNRFWQMYFGTGLVKTVEDFGSQGDQPSHPELLDWLAVEFMESGWDVKALQKKILMSETYRQNSQITEELEQRDPDNRLLARGPRFRLAAEMVRDQALAASGLLVEKTGGPSVKPYQPAGVWSDLTSGGDYKSGHGADLYRRSLYTFWKRTIAPPSMMTFDASQRESCVVRENRTNTPLQALTLMNDVAYVEAARKMAERMMSEGGATPAARIDYGMQLATARHASANESRVLLDGYQEQLDRYKTNPEAAVRLLSQGESARNAKLDSGELAAYTMVASLLLNLDETVTKE